MAIEKFPVEAGHIMMFARAVGDANRFTMTSLRQDHGGWVDHRPANVCAGECTIRS